MDLRTVRLRRALMGFARYDDETQWPRNFRPKRPRGNRRS
jgi:hypothetical protein